MADPVDVTEQLLARRAPLHASVSAAGRALLTTVRVPPGSPSVEVRLSLLDTATGAEADLTNVADGDSGGVWAPDGTGLAWCSAEVQVTL